MSYLRGLRCVQCGEELGYKRVVYLCPRCGGLLDPYYDYGSVAKNVSKQDISCRYPSIWKWKELLPVEDESNLISLGEGGTPLIKCNKLAKELGVKEIYVKDDALTNPTGSLKDRRISVGVSKAVELGYDTTFTITSGNNGASLAAYSSRAGLKCVIIFSVGATKEKMLTAIALGAKVIKVVGEDSLLATTVNNVLSGKKLDWYDCGFRVFEPFMYEGAKTNAMEVCESLGWRNPDWVLHPSVGSMGIIKAWKGYKELSKLGWTTGKLPRLVAVQPAGVAPIVNAFKEGLSEIVPVQPGKTIAEAISSVGTGDLGKWTLDVLRESGGSAVGVTDDEILYGLKLLTREGILVEPSAAVAIPAVKKLIDEGVARTDETFVCDVTGAGWKNFSFMENTFGAPKIVPCEEKEIRKFLSEFVYDLSK